MIHDARRKNRADHFANLARVRHSQTGADLAVEVARNVDDAVASRKYAAMVMMLWPTKDEDELRKAQRRVVRRTRCGRRPLTRHQKQVDGV